MKVWLAVLAVALAACGSKDGGGSDAPKDQPAENEISPADWDHRMAMYVMKGEQLPECAADTKGALVYHEVDKEFKVCNGKAWIAMDLRGKDGVDGEQGAQGTTGKNGADGMAIVDAQNLIHDGMPNMCTRYSNEICVFGGGMLTEYSNGIVAFEGKLVYAVEYEINGGTDTDSDVQNISSATMYCTPEHTICWTFLRTIARPGSDDYKSLWLAYEPATKDVTLVYDVDDDDALTADDETVAVLTKKSVLIEAD